MSGPQTFVFQKGPTRLFWGGGGAPRTVCRTWGPPPCGTCSTGGGLPSLERMNAGFGGCVGPWSLLCQQPGWQRVSVRTPGGTIFVDRYPKQLLSSGLLFVLEVLVFVGPEGITTGPRHLRRALGARVGWGDRTARGKQLQAFGNGSSK